MPLEVAARQVEGVTVVDVGGNLRPRTDGTGLLLSAFVSELLDKGSKQILLNLKGVQKHDNSGVGDLVASLNASRTRRCELKLANVSQTLYARLTFARLNTIFEIYEDEVTAVRAFKEKLSRAVEATAIDGFKGKELTSIRLAVREVDKITVVDVSGNLWPRTDGSGPLLSQFVGALLETGIRQILLNLKGVEKHDGSGVEELVACRKAIREKRGRLKLVNVNQTLSTHLAMGNRSFAIFEDEATAINDFGEYSATSIRFSIRQVDTITVVDVSGNLWPRTDKGGHALSESVQDLAEEGNHKVLLNLKGVREHDNSGVGELVACLKAMRAQHGQLKLANVSQTLKARLALARLTKIFETY